MIGKIFISIISFSLCMIINAYCDDTEIDKAAIKSVKGEVSAIDWVGQKLIVRTFSLGQTDDITFFVPDNCKITKSTNTIFFSDIFQSNKVTVEFYSTLSGLRAVNITVKQ